MRRLFVCFILIMTLSAAGTSNAQTYQYDALGRLQAANYTDGSSIPYDYDANSNITRIRFAPAPAALPPDAIGHTGFTGTSLWIDPGRQRVYILNVVKCRPPNNRDPQENEIRECENYLKQQIALIQPAVICALGRVAAQWLLQAIDWAMELDPLQRPQNAGELLNALKETLSPQTSDSANLS